VVNAIRELPRVDADTVDALRDALERAERGEVIGVAMLLFERERGRLVSYAGVDGLEAKIGALYRLANQLSMMGGEK
jgi:hypothetical protein